MSVFFVIFQFAVVDAVALALNKPEPLFVFVAVVRALSEADMVIVTVIDAPNPDFEPDLDAEILRFEPEAR